MESPEDEDDLKLVKASAGLLADLENALPKLLWKATTKNSKTPRVHTRVKQRDLDYVTQLIDPFQGEPQLLDARLKYVLPPIVDAYLEYLKLDLNEDRLKSHLDLQSAICVILYTLCKVRGYKVIVGFLNNEPRYLEPVLERLEAALNQSSENQVGWQVPYVLLLWLSHLLLTPFDLDSISDTPITEMPDPRLQYDNRLPQIALRIVVVGLKCLPMPTKAQDGAAMLLVRLVTRPDMQKLDLANSLLSECTASIESQDDDTPVTIYERLGPLRYLSGIAAAAELSHLIPTIYRVVGKNFEDENSTFSSNAVAKRLYIKTLRNVAILCLRIGDADGPLLSFLQTTSVLEDVIDYLLRSLGDRDTPVRYAAAKGISRIVLELEAEMGHEVIQAVLDTFKEDLPRSSETLDFSTVNALKWHGLTLALAHTLFKRSASPDQLPDIITALVSALQFEQRTATGSSVGTNVRDAANFGIWSLSRRYTTSELLTVNTGEVKSLLIVMDNASVIGTLAINLILSACLDPVGNIRRGSSAALQELIGRHPNQVYEGISLVQIVDYQAVGLRRRAMVVVAFQAAELEKTYWLSLVNGLLGWRGLGSPDVSSREAAASALAIFSTSSFDSAHIVLGKVRAAMSLTGSSEVEDLHGLSLSLAKLLDALIPNQPGAVVNSSGEVIRSTDLWSVVGLLQMSMKSFSPRLLRSELPSATAEFLSALCRCQSSAIDLEQSMDLPFETLDALTEQLFTRHEGSIQQHIPSLAQSLLNLKRKTRAPLGCIGAQHLKRKVVIEGSRSTLNGACRAVALGALAPLYQDGLCGEKTTSVIEALANLTNAMNVDWRIVGLRALQLAVTGVNDNAEKVEESIMEIIVEAVHRGLNDYTIDERGDIGSLVRLQAIACTCIIFSKTAFAHCAESVQTLQANIYRLSLEKLDRVRLEAARCRSQFLEDKVPSADIATVSSHEYFAQNLHPMAIEGSSWKHRALLEGIVSCAGISAEPLLQASRIALFLLLSSATLDHLHDLMTTFSTILKSNLLETTNQQPSLELLAFLLDTRILHRLVHTNFKWRGLLSTVQKSHHKSNDIPKILAAVHVYRGLVDVPMIREEVMKKLISMLKTNPYPRVRGGVAETLYFITQDPELRDRDWMRPPAQNKDELERLQQRLSQTISRALIELKKIN